MSKRNLIYRSFIFFLCFALVNLAVPQSLVLAVGQPLAGAIAARQKAAAEQKKALDARKAISRTRPLDSKELSSLQGRVALCPYVAGANKWDPSFQGVDMISGNYSMSATDLSFDGGYGIPVNITRSYSANDANDGPFGPGWTLSADVRTTAGGVLKSKSAPVLSVPTTYKERSPLETDPNVTTQPIDAVVAEDASGKQETIQKDADGCLSAAAWDQNQTSTQYQSVVSGTSVYQIALSQTTTTPDGTVYQYAAEGSYTSGTTPYNNPGATGTPANVLKCISATDRNGNTTTYNYGTTQVLFQKIDGQTSEHPLTSVNMPNGHIITLVWGTGNLSNRVIQVHDNALNPANPAPRYVNYGYDPASKYLTSVTTDIGSAIYTNGLTTSYVYKAPVNNFNLDGSLPVLYQIIDPRGLKTTINSFVGVATVMPYAASVEATLVNSIVAPNNVTTLYNWKLNQGNEVQGTVVPDNGNFCGWYSQYAGPVGSPLIATYFNYTSLNGTSIQVNQFYNNLQNTGPCPNQVDVYDCFSQNNLSSASYTMPAQDPNGTNLAQKRYLMNSPFAYEETLTTTTYNFQGKPLDSWVDEYEAPLSGAVIHNRSAQTSYAYWGASKYYQQKAVKDPGGRISFTDYYTSTDTNLGNRGQKYQVFDPKYGGTQASQSGYYSVPVPQGSTPLAGDLWRYMVTAVPNQFSGQFTYNSWGQPTQVLKLQSATAGTPSTYRYVTTQSYYGTATDGSWGQAKEVIEDFGGINRTTQNLAYTSWGKPSVVQDGAGHTFTTNFDPDGKVLSITQNGSPVVSYTYGTSGTANGQPTAVVDNLSGVEQDISYNGATGSGAGQPFSIKEIRGGTVDNTCDYTYGPSGDRLTATYYQGSDTSGTVLAKWGYFDYLSVGSPSKGAHAFQTLCKLDNGGNRTQEEFHYAYDQQGRLYEATFAQTPSNLTPDSSGYYDGYEAATRARAHYEYDGAGRMTWLGHYWDTLGTGNTYTSQAIVGQSCDYEVSVTAPSRGVKTDSVYKTATTPGSASWATSQTDTYGYDAQLDYLTAASYGDGLANATPTWSYDAAGNRNDAVTDNLNRATSLGGTTVTNDILGNRITKGSASYGWDMLNRMTTFTSSGTTSYVYRADGMRVSKSNSSGSTSYRYDGQMGMEDVDFASNGSVSKVTDYGIGARGIDAMYVTQSGTTSTSYPLYDAHGNMISTLAKQGTGGFAYSGLRTFDAWGVIRRGAPTGDPKGRYCASLGQKQDDESGLVYMNARYYEPSAGRFICEDPAKDGFNYFVYCNNSPTNLVDGDGENPALLWLGLFLGVAALLNILWPASSPLAKAVKLIISSVLAAIGMVRTVCAFLAADGTKGGAGSSIGAGLAALVAGVLCEIALQQIGVAILLENLNSDSSAYQWCANSAGSPGYQFGL